jgi:hypothetical protein
MASEVNANVSEVLNVSDFQVKAMWLDQHKQK